MTGSIHDLTRRAWEFLAEHPGPWLASSVASIVMFVVSILLVPLVIGSAFCGSTWVAGC